MVSFLVIGGHYVSADVVSLQSNFVAGEANVIDHLNNDRIGLTNGVNNIRGVFSGSVQSSGQIKADTVGEENMADNANPRLRTAEGAWCNDFTYSGLLPTTTSGTLVGTIPAGTAYPSGYRVVKTGGTAHTFTASKWTWVDMDTLGSFTYLEQAIGTIAPSVTANSMRLCRVSTDTTQIAAVQDLRVTNCSTGPLSNFADVSGESTLSDLFSYGNGGYQSGLSFQQYDNTNITVNPGSMYINGYYRTLAAAKQVPITVNGNSLTGVDGLDAGAVGASTLYYVYATADISGTKPPIVLYSTSLTPAGPTNYRRIGEVTTDVASTFASKDTTSISYVGKIRQIKTYKTGAAATGTTVIPFDNTIPQNTEGDEYMTLAITPTSANSRLRVEATMYATYSISQYGTMALFRDSGADAIAVAAEEMLDPAAPTQLHVFHLSTIVDAGSTTRTTFKIRAGGGAAGTFSFNCERGSQLYNRALASNITITEFEA